MRSAEDDLVTALLTASRVMVAVSTRSLEAVQHLVTIPQFRALVVLENNDGTNLGGLAQLLDVNASTAVRMMDRLVSAGLVTREDNPASRREVVLGLTPAGRRVVRRVTAARRIQIARIVQAMPTARRGQLVLALRAFAAAAGEPEPAGADVERSSG